MLSNIGMPGLILLLVITLIIFGPKKLPEIGSAMGQTLAEFKKATNNLMGESNSSKKSEDAVEKKDKDSTNIKPVPKNEELKENDIS